jgi:hypothetical protein
VDEHDEDQRRGGPGAPAPGELPGINGSPTGASFRDGPRRRPQAWGAMLLTAVPPLLLIAVVLVVTTR